jgi:hypothetical protein
MNIREVIKTALTNSQSLLDMFLGDLSDADLLVRPIPEANHPAWQLGHLIGGEVHLLSQTLPEFQNCPPVLSSNTTRPPPPRNRHGVS